jgi:hypothetical protein
MSEKKMCLFLPGKQCNLDVNEIPLEVCKLCLEAFKDYSSNVTVKRPVAKEREEAVSPIQATSVQTKGTEMETLGDINRLLMNDKISVEEYLQRRKEAVKRLQEKFHR